VTPESTLLIVSGDSNGNGYIYQINDATGNLAQVGSALTLGANPRSIKIVPLTVVE
jgi:6-phosphogluconolactonase (cycloisomerase 2 family)